MAQLNPTRNQFTSHPPGYKGCNNKNKSLCLMLLAIMRHANIKNKSDFSDDVYPEVLCVQVSSRLKCI